MKYELTNETKAVNGKTLFRIRALEDFSNVKAGDLGGWIESESNLSQEGTCWVYGKAQVFDEAQVSGSAWVYSSAQVYDSAQVFGGARVSGGAQVYGEAQVFGGAQVFGSAWVYSSARVFGAAQVFGEAQVSGEAQVYGEAQVFGGAQVFGSAWVSGEARVSGSAQVFGKAYIKSVADYIVVGPAQSSGRFTTAYIVENSIVVTTGCFTGTLEEFKLAIEKTHGHNPSYLKQYRGFANFIGENFETL